MNVSHFFAFMAGINLFGLILAVGFGLGSTAFLAIVMLAFNGFWTQYYANQQGKAE